MEIVSLRLFPAQDLKEELDRLVEEQEIEAACILTCLGSLNKAVLRFADQERPEHLNGPFEIVSLTGVLSKHGSHYHITIADRTGTCFGAHLLEGCKVYTTAEIIIGIVPGCSFQRALDPRTGYPELEVVNHPSEQEPHQ